MTKHDDFIQKIKDMNMPPLKKEDVAKHVLYYLNTELWLTMSLPADPLTLGKINMLIKTIETVTTIAIRAGAPIKEDHHAAIHRDAEVAEYKKILENII